MLKSLTLPRDRIADPTVYPFSVPAIQSLRSLDFTARIAFFVGENGTGKSTLLEAMAGQFGFGHEGGNRNFQSRTEDLHLDTDPLARALRLSFDNRTGEGFFFRAESLFNVATKIDELGVEDGYGGRSLHAQSHGESFLTILDHKFRRSGLFLLDEPEAALSPQRQLSFLLLLHQTLRDYKDAQFIISTHSPMLLGFPGAQIFSFDDGVIHEIAYEETAPLQIVRRFLNDRERFLEQLFRPEVDEPTLFD
jgi:predicted ATPase